MKRLRVKLQFTGLPFAPDGHLHDHDYWYLLGQT